MIDTPIQPDLSAFDATRLGGPASKASGPSTAEVFAGFMDRARTEGQGAEAQLREAAEKLVSTTLLMPMFQKMRDDPLAANLFHGGRTEKIFQQQLDQVLSDRIAGATGFDLVDSVYNEISRGVSGKAVNTYG